MYRDILRRAWQMTRKHKYLWLFGLFATVLSSAGASAWDLFVSNTTRVFDQPEFFQNLKILYSSGTLGLLFENVAGNISNFWNLSPDLYILMILMLLLIVIAILSQGALIHATSNFDDNKKSQFQDNVTVARESFWRLTGLQVLFQLAIYGSLLIIGAPLLSVFLIQGAELPSVIFSFISFIILLPLSIIIYFLLLFSSIYTVINKTAVWKSIADAWALFKKNWLISLEFSLILFVINLVAGFLLVLVFAVPTVAIIQSQTAITSFTVWSISLMLVIFLIASGILTTFQFSATVMFVKRIARETNRGFIGKLFSKLFKKTEKSI